MEQAVKLPKGCYVGTKIKEHTFDHITTSETVFENGMTSDWHFHENPHFSHILSGGSTEVKEKQEEIQYAGRGLYYYPGVSHQNVSYKAGTRIFNLELEPDFFSTYEIKMPEESVMFEPGLPLSSGGLLRILHEHRNNDRDSLISIEQLCIDMIIQNPTVQPNYPEWTKRINTVLNDNWNTQHSLTELAASVSIHPVTLSKYFGKYFNCTLGSYIRKIRTERALLLIKSGKHSLTEIAYLCGFFDQAHFTKSFRIQTGMLPKVYKDL